MRSFILAASVLAACAIGCSRSGEQKTAGSPSPPAVQVAGTAYGDFVIGEPITHENLTIFPISSKTPKNDDRYITLDEGLANGSIKVIETGAAEGSDGPAAPEVGRDARGDDNPFGCPENDNESNQPNPPAEQAPAQHPANTPAQEPAEPADDLFGSPNDSDNAPFQGRGVDGDVNTLMVLNKSGKPLYLMPGEIITGGNQDRTIGQEIVIDSGDKPVSIDVFCVEQGRWGGRSVASTTSQLNSARDFDSNLSLVVSQTQAVNVDELAKEAQRGKFVASLGHLSKDGRLAVQQAGEQGTVWQEVAKQNSKVGNDSESDNFAANYATEDISKAVEPFVKKLMPAGDTQQVVGVAVAVNGKMLSVDVFESTPLFKKFWPKLLKSYALDAVAAKSDKEAGEKPKLIGSEDCVAFLKEMEKTKAETVSLNGGDKIDKRDSTIGASFSYYDPKTVPDIAAPSAGAGGGFGGGGFGGGVHTSVLAK